MELPENVDIIPSALREANRALRWYERRSPWAADKFIEELGRAVVKISEEPERWPLYSKRIRFVKLRRFPYVVYFQAMGPDAMIVAVAHASRRPRYWRWRL